jgi:hypothetical protein
VNLKVRVYPLPARPLLYGDLWQKRKPLLPPGDRPAAEDLGEPLVPDRIISAFKNAHRSRWRTPVIPATQGAEIRRITVQSQTRQIVGETLS